MIRSVFLTLGMWLWAGLLLAQMPREYAVRLLQQHPELHAEAAMLEAAMQKPIQSSALPDPVLAAGFFMLPLSSGDWLQGPRLAVDQMLPWWGVRAAERRLAQRQYQIQDAALQQKQLQLLLELEENYWAWFLLQQQRRIDIEQLQWIDDALALLKNQLTQGKANLSDYLQLELQKKERMLSLKTLDDRISLQQLQLNRLMGHPDTLALRMPDSLPSPDSLLLWSEQGLDRHPLLQQFDLKREVRREAQRLARLRRLPQIGLGIEYVRLSQPMEMNMLGWGQHVFMPMFSISLPVWRKPNQAIQREAMAMQQNAEYEQQQAQNQFDISISEAATELKNQIRWWHFYTQSIGQLQQVLQLMYTDYAQGRLPWTELIVMQQMLFDYKRKQAEAYTAYQQARAVWAYWQATFPEP